MRAKSYIRSHLQSLYNSGAIRKVLFQPPYLIAFTGDRDPLPNPLILSTPVGQVEILTYSAQGKDEFDLLSTIYSTNSSDRRKLMHRYPELLIPQLPPQPRLGKLIKQILGITAPTEPQAEEDIVQ